MLLSKVLNMTQRSKKPRISLARLDPTEQKHFQRLKEQIKREWMPTITLKTTSPKNLSTVSTKDLKLISKKLPTILFPLLNLS